MKGRVIIGADGLFYRLRCRDRGFPHPEDRGLWRADRVTWDGDHWGFHDDDDWMLTDDGRIIAREAGWELRRERAE